jgi:hypothetical protein
VDAAAVASLINKADLAERVRLAPGHASPDRSLPRNVLDNSPATHSTADERTSTHPGYAGDPWSFGKPWLCAVPEPSATGEFLRAGSKDLDSRR